MSVQTNRVIEKAHRYVERRQFDKALEAYDRALETDPEDVRILHRKGDLLVRMEVMPQAVQTYLKLAGLYSFLGFHVKAIAVYKQALKTEAAPVEVHLQLCQAYQRLKMKREAIESLEIVIAEYERTRRFDEIEEPLQRLIEIAPDSIEPTMRLCDLLLLQDQKESAVDLLAMTAEKLANEERIHEHREVMARLSALDSDYDMAESCWEKRFRTLLDRASGALQPQEISDTDILPVETGASGAPGKPEAPTSNDELAFAGMGANRPDNVGNSHSTPAQELLPREAAFTEDELEECLKDIDFFVLQKIFHDAWNLLAELKAKGPNNRRVLSCIQVVGQLLGSVS